MKNKATTTIALALSLAASLSSAKAFSFDEDSNADLEKTERSLSVENDLENLAKNGRRIAICEFLDSERPICVFKNELDKISAKRLEELTIKASRIMADKPGCRY